MAAKDPKKKSQPSDSKEDTVFAGGNPAFDERKPSGPRKSSETVLAGVNPDFDERQPGKTKPKAA